MKSYKLIIAFAFTILGFATTIFYSEKAYGQQKVLFKPYMFYLNNQAKDRPRIQELEDKVRQCTPRELYKLPPVNPAVYYLKTTPSDKTIAKMETNPLGIDTAVFIISEYIKKPPELIESYLSKIGNIFIVRACSQTFAINVFWQKEQQAWVMRSRTLEEIKDLLRNSGNLTMFFDIKIYYGK